MITQVITIFPYHWYMYIRLINDYIVTQQYTGKKGKDNYMKMVGDSKLKLWTGHGECEYTIPSQFGVSYTSLHSIITVAIPVRYISILSVSRHAVHHIIPEKHLEPHMHVIIIIILNKICCVHTHELYT